MFALFSKMNKLKKIKQNKILNFELWLRHVYFETESY